MMSGDEFVKIIQREEGSIREGVSAISKGGEENKVDTPSM